jgi:hypothetical protein
LDYEVIVVEFSLETKVADALPNRLHPHLHYNVLRIDVSSRGDERDVVAAAAVT